MRTQREAVADLKNPDRWRRYHLAWSMALDAGNRHARKAGRSAWNAEDYNAACRCFHAAFPDDTPSFPYEAKP